MHTIPGHPPLRLFTHSHRSFLLSYSILYKTAVLASLYHTLTLYKMAELAPLCQFQYHNAIGCRKTFFRFEKSTVQGYTHFSTYLNLQGCFQPDTHDNVFPLSPNMPTRLSFVLIFIYFSGGVFAGNHSAGFPQTLICKYQRGSKLCSLFCSLCTSKYTHHTNCQSAPLAAAKA